MKPADAPLNNRASLFKQTEPPHIRQLSFAVHRSALTPFHRIRVGH